MKAHIEALQKSPKQALLELRGLLNLQRMGVERGNTGRDPSMEEIRMFQFLWSYSDQLK